MRLTPRTVMKTLHAGGLCALVAAGVALTGPFHYDDLGLPFPDTVAHAILFYGVTLALLTALPRSRAAEVALGAVAVGAMSEVVQSLVGREMSLHDLAGDSIGVAFAYTPIAITRLRELIRTYPDLSFAEIHARDPRRGQKRFARWRAAFARLLG